MYLVFDQDNNFVLAQKSLNKFYKDNSDFNIVELYDDVYDDEYYYSYSNGNAIKGDKITLSEEEILTIQNEIESRKHEQPRMLAYPNISEQLDKLFHDIDNGTLDKTGSFYTAIKLVKDTYPKNI